MFKGVKRLQNKNERAINKRNVDLIIAREEAKRKKRQMKERTGNPKIDGPLEDFERVYGYKFEPKFADDMKDGGLAMAIEKVKAKEMKNDGNVPKPKPRPKSLKADKTESLDKEFSKKVAKQNEKAIKGVKKAMGGLKDVPPGSKGKGLSKLPTPVRNKMGFKKKGGTMKMRGGGMAVQGTGFRGVR